MIEFAINNIKSVFIKLSLFFTLKSLHLYKNFDIINFLNISTCKWINKRKIIDILEAI